MPSITSDHRDRMRVDPTGRANRLSGRRVERSGHGSGRSFASQLDAAMGNASLTPNAVVDSVSSVLALQEVGEAGARTRARRRGEDILDRLDEIRHGLLLGTISRTTLERLEQVVQSRIEEASDPRLADVLREIEVRARVELAKLDRGV
ncbi:MAG: flagellar assembly protein FliX [Alphaproteobacteria bacterium]